MSRYRDWDLSCKVYVGNLGSSASKHDIESAFSKYGPLKNVWVARNPPGFAFVEYEDPRDAEDAVRGLDGTRVCGSRVRVEMSSGRSRRGGGGRRGSGPTSHSRHLLLLRVMSRGHLTTTNQPQPSKSANLLCSTQLHVTCVFCANLLVCLAHHADALIPGPAPGAVHPAAHVRTLGTGGKFNCKLG
ncbi:unnamed protein product, partial [Timema podura]|nr:unnamed protein product [Timema podura]